MSLQDFNIPRCLKPEGFGRVTRAELHHFADASQDHGYGTVSYLRLINDQGNIRCSFVMGKSRVKPLNGAVTVPKLELAAATLATRINKVVTKELKGRLTIDSVTYWTDSMIVLKYIANEKRRFVTFVANRVTVIRQESEPSQWRHVRSELNPADYAFRGIKASETKKLEKWKNGADFLWKDTKEWPPQPAEVSEDLLDSDEGVKREKVTARAAVVQEVVDVTEAEKKIVKAVQAQSFPVETDKTVLTGQLARLKPFEDEGILRVGEILKHSELQYDAKYPMILPGKHQVTRLIVLNYHHLNGHVGSHQVLAEIRQRFWIVKGVSSVKRVLSKCHVCKRQSAKLGEQMTAQLPVVRVSSDSDRIIYPFAAVGLDYFGPLYVKTGPNTRSKKNATLNKRYGCIFTCLRYRAVHIEVAEDLSTDSFINAVLRFVGRRGPPRIIYSDNVGERLLNDEALRTFLVEVETILNDRPITPVSSDPQDLEALTPNHILLLRRNSSSAPDVFKESDKFKARWKHIHLLADHFWQRWTKEYLPTLQERQKWLRPQPNFEIGDLVLMADRNTPRGQWPKALVEQTFPDSEGLVRQVVIRTADGVYRRDVRKLCLLEEKLLTRIQEQEKPSRVVFKQ
ncbi:uncharacterized protein LOC141890859 [Acropora palmata]|uniref:uncharacterized protein LOC141890859 n=1 Tax=Acropora palmata TaxID=6131 RepID=UPI003D9FEDC8